MRLHAPFVAIVIALGCRAWSFDAAMDDGGTTTGGGQTTHATASTVEPTQPSTSAASDTSTSSSDGDPTAPETGYAIIDQPDAGSDRCDVWAQDCPTGFKCTPWEPEGSGWTSSHCTALADDPKRAGEPCMVFGSGVGGVDDCELGAMCWNVDPETGVGRCVAQCMGSEVNPICADPCERCFIAAEGELQLCFPDCDPLVQDCNAGESCIPVDESFTCGPDASGEQGAIGDPCEYVNVCDPSLFCANHDVVPNCDRSSGCCAPFCDLTAADFCGALLPGTSCVPWYAEGASPDACFAGRSVIGACILPG